MSDQAADAMGPRMRYIDCDNRRTAKTGRYCCVCNQDISNDVLARSVHLVNGGAFVLHPADEHLYVSDAGDLGAYLIGPKCARKIGLEWSRP